MESDPTERNVIGAELPKDKWHLIYMSMLIQGVGVLAPWNMFIMAKNYFVDYKLKGTAYASNYLVYVGYAYHLPNLIFSWMNVFVNLGGNLTRRIMVSLCFMILLFLVTTILAMADSSTWTAAFFWLTMLIVFVLCACTAVYQNCVYGVAGLLPPRYTAAIVVGNNIVGTFVVFLDWVTVSAHDLRVSAIYYFLFGMSIMFICLNNYYAMPLNRFFRYNEKQHHAITTNAAQQSIPYLEILRVIWVQLYNIFIIYFVALAVFPAVHSDIFSMDNPKQEMGKGFLGDNFVRVTCFLTFNLTTLLGNITGNLIKYPTRRWLVVLTTVRLVFIPLFLTCNYHPKDAVRTMVVLVRSDFTYWFIAVLQGWSLGHCGALGFLYVGEKLKPEHTPKAGMMAGAMMVTGVISGVTCSGVSRYIVTADMWK